MKILVALDGSSNSEAALRPLKEMVDTSKNEVNLVRVIDYRTQKPLWPSKSKYGSVVGSELSMSTEIGYKPYERMVPPAESSSQRRERMRTEALEYLQNISKGYFRGKASPVVLAGSDPAKAIVEHAKKEGTDLIVITTNGRTGLAKVLMGSVASNVLKSGVAPVLMIRPRLTRDAKRASPAAIEAAS